MTTDTKDRPTAKARGLGKGLSALMGDAPAYEAPATNAPPYSRETPLAGGRPETLFIDEIRPGRFQPRTHFDQVGLVELADSIRRNGIMQPILVRETQGGKYEIIAGERRFRAASIAGINRIPAIVRELDDKQALEIALVENVQREDLNPLEEAAGYNRLMEEFAYTQETLSTVINKSRSHVANLLRLLELPEEIRHLLQANRISAGHARALSGAPDAVDIAQKIVEKGLSVRQTEKLARLSKGPSEYKLRKQAREKYHAQFAHLPNSNPPATELPPLPGLNPPPVTQLPAPAFAPQAYAPPAHRDPDIMALEDTLSENLGLKVSINDRGQSGDITIVYDSLEQLDEILRRLGGSI